MKPPLTPFRLGRALDSACALFDVQRRAIAGNGRTRPVSAARQVVYAALYLSCNTTFVEIGQALGRDHSTVIYGVQQAEEKARLDQDYAAALQLVREAVGR